VTLDQIIRECQRAVGADDDGRPGIDTWTRIHHRLIGSKSNADPVTLDGKVDARSEKNIATLHPKVQPYARALIQKAAAKGWKFIITSGTRTYAEQDALYRQRPQVTKARGGHSNHNFGIAFDVTLFNGSQPVWSSPLYDALAVIATDLGLEWGGSWKSFKDKPHYQLRPSWASGMSESVMLTELRRRKAAGRDFFA
jgi:peptidoglycan L-alanyl-D-glutamate endopeptidase CwlK